MQLTGKPNMNNYINVPENLSSKTRFSSQDVIFFIAIRYGVKFYDEK